MKIIKLILFSTLCVATCLAASGFVLLGLDDDGINQIDPVLETVSDGEEIGFEQVARLIESFVRNQYERRKLARNLEHYQDDLSKHSESQYTMAYRDLPRPLYATRDVHRKAHGCYAADLKIRESLLSDLNQAGVQTIRDSNELGVFKPNFGPNFGPNAGPHADPHPDYDAIVRFSNGHPQNRDDKIPDARGFAVKLLPRGTLNPHPSQADLSAIAVNSATVLDILAINFPTFFVDAHNTALKYYEINQSFLAGAYDFSGLLKVKTAEGLSIFGSGLSAMEVQLATAVNGSVIKSPLFQEYFSMVPSRLGMPGSNRAVKYIWAPTSCSADEKAFKIEKERDWPGWTKRRDFADPLNPFKKNFLPPYAPYSRFESNYLRKNLESRLKKGEFCFTLYLQPYLDQLSTNIEDSTDIWLRSETERNWWIDEIVPSKLSPLARAIGFDRDAYIDKIKSKKISPAIPAATLRIHQISASDETVPGYVCEDLSFNPWNGDIVHHKPLGIVSRMKRRVYNASRRVRHAINGLREVMTERSSN